MSVLGAGWAALPQTCGGRGADSLPGGERLAGDRSSTGPAPAGAAEPLVRVLLRTTEAGDALRVRAARGGLSVADPQGMPVIRLEAERADGRVSAMRDGLAWNGAPTGPARLEIVADDGVIEIDGAAYRGRVRLIHTAGRGIAVVNVLPVEQYLAGVLRGEIPQRFAPPAQRAMAVAARTYALYHCAISPPDADFDLYAGEVSQVYRGLAGEDARARDAVARTRGIVLTAETEGRTAIFETFYSSTCGGGTASGAAFSGSVVVGALRGDVRCEFCAAAGSPFLTWPEVRIAKRELSERLAARYPALAALRRIDSMEVVERNGGGRPTLMRLRGADGRTRTLRPEELRVGVGLRALRSSWFEIVDDGDEFVFRGGRGFGHGVGLCQYGAEGLARAKRSAVEILVFYYPGSRPVRAY